MATLFERRQELINQLSGGKGFAFLTGGQKTQVQNILSGEFSKLTPQVSPITTVAPTFAAPAIKLPSQDLATPPEEFAPSAEIAPSSIEGERGFGFTRQLDAGTSGADVAELQKFLNDIGFSVATSGPGSPGQETDFFGPLTQEAIKDFQCSTGIVCSGDPETTGFGRVGPLTLDMLSRFGSSGEVQGQVDGGLAEPEFAADVPSTIPSDVTEEALGDDLIGTGDIRGFLQRQEGLQKDLAERRAELRQLEIGGLQGQTEIAGQPIPQPLIGAQAEKLREQVAFKALPVTAEIQGISDQLGIQQDTLSNFISLARLQQEMQQDDPDRETQVITDTDASGNVTATIIDKNTGEVIRQTSLGQIGKPQQAAIQFNLDKPLSLSELEAFGVPAGTTQGDVVGQIPVSRQDRKAIAEMTSAVPVLNELQSAIDKLDLATKLIDRGTTGSRLFIESKDPASDAAFYIRLKKQFGTILARAAGERGVVTDEDVNRLTSNIPTFFDSPESAKRKIGTMERVMNEIALRVGSTLLAPSGEVLKSVQQPTETSGDLSDLDFKF